MPKVKTKFVCQSCGANFAAWSGKCNLCNEWNSLVEEIVSSGMGDKRSTIINNKPERLSEIKGDNFKRFKTGIEEFDRVLGGGIVPGSLVLLGGDPGIGKSTLILQIAKQLTINNKQSTVNSQPAFAPGYGTGRQLTEEDAVIPASAGIQSLKEKGLDSRCGENDNKNISKESLLKSEDCSPKTTLYSSGEESVNQIKLRADRLNVASDNILLLGETNIETILAICENEKPSFLIVDSIQTMYSNDLTGAAGNVGQVNLCTTKLMEMAKRLNIATFIIGHVTKEGNIAGPKVLEHLVDVVLYMEGDKDRDFRIIRGIKNRYGSTNETGIFEMHDDGLAEVSNPSKLLLQEREEMAPGSIIFPTMEGTRPLLVEVQALCSTTNFGYPKRTAIGFDTNRLQLLVAVLQKRAGINLFNQDIYVNIVGGLKINEPALDLAVCIAIASSYKNKALQKDIAAFGEVGLAGEIRMVHNVSERLKEAEKLGYTRCITPKNGKGAISAKDLSEAIKLVLK